MTTHHDKVIEILASVGDKIADAAMLVATGPKKVLLYVITVGLETIQSRQRRRRRRELRTEVKPEFKQGKTVGSVVLTKAAKERLLRATQDLFGDDGWMIGSLNLGDFSKEKLLSQAASERSSAKGSIRNAQFYEALAEPLAAGQLAREYWKSETARKIKEQIWQQTEQQNPNLV